MRRARENASIFKLYAALKRLLDEFENFDTARRLCADYCIGTNDIALMDDEIPKPRKSKQRLTFAVRSDKTIDEAYLLAR
ncbi:MAG TPA: hypothetical protein VIM99_14090 [Blastocatellia bacterium]